MSYRPSRDPSPRRWNVELSGMLYGHPALCAISGLIGSRLIDEPPLLHPKNQRRGGTKSPSSIHARSVRYRKNGRVLAPGPLQTTGATVAVPPIKDRWNRAKVDGATAARYEVERKNGNRCVECRTMLRQDADATVTDSLTCTVARPVEDTLALACCAYAANEDWPPGGHSGHCSHWPPRYDSLSTRARSNHGIAALPNFTIRTRLVELVPFSLQRRVLNGLVSLARRFLRDPVVEYRGQRIHLLPNDESSARIVVQYRFWGRWKHEPGSQATVERIIARRGRPTVFVDGGASFGMYSFLAASLPTVTEVLAIEASPATHARLVQSVSGSDYAARIHCHLGGLTDRADRILMLDAGARPSEHFQVQTHDRDATGSCVLPALTLDNVLAQSSLRTNDCLFVKLDIEGSEDDAITGMQRHLAQHPDVLLMLEFHAGLLNREPGGAEAFAHKLLSLACAGVYVIDVQDPRLYRLSDAEEFMDLARRLGQCSFPQNLCNVLLTSQPLEEEVIEIASGLPPWITASTLSIEFEA